MSNFTDVEKDYFENVMRKDELNKELFEKNIKEIPDDVKTAVAAVQEKRRRQKMYYFLKMPSDWSNMPEKRAIYNSASSTDNPIINGHMRVYIYYLLLEFSIKFNGSIHNGRYPYTPTRLAFVLNVPEDMLIATIDVCEKLGLITINDDASIEMLEFEELVAKTSKIALDRSQQRKKANVKEAEEYERQRIIAKKQWIHDDM